MTVTRHASPTDRADAPPAGANLTAWPVCGSLRRRAYPWIGALIVSSGLALSAASADPLSHRDDLDPRDRARVAAVTAPTGDFTVLEAFEPLVGGLATSRARPGPQAFAQTIRSLEDPQAASLGRALFRKLWVSAPSSTQASDGLGPLYNARACETCHQRDGRGSAATDGTGTLVLRLSSVGPEGARPDPTYGSQLQDAAIAGHAAEGRIAVRWSTETVRLADGTTVDLRRPVYTATDLAYGPLAADVRLSPRLPSPLIGLGLLEAIHPGDILAAADPDDRDGDGISGRPGQVVDPATGQPVLGRFGWKAAEPDLRTQTASAFSADLGLSTSLFPSPGGDCTDAEAACLQAPHGAQPRFGDVEVPDDVLDLVTFYVATLAVPARRNAGDPQVLAGKQVFTEVGCADCHRPKFVTRRDAALPQLAFQLIWPYTDLLLHDMGEGLADDRPEGGADGREWRTPPLWGIGLTGTVAGRTEFLHDGRARSLLEAILWHGGEAQAARERVMALDCRDREALLAFLNSL